LFPETFALAYAFFARPNHLFDWTRQRRDYRFCAVVQAAADVTDWLRESGSREVGWVDASRKERFLAAPAHSIWFWTKIWPESLANSRFI